MNCDCDEPDSLLAGAPDHLLGLFVGPGHVSFMFPTPLITLSRCPVKDTLVSPEIGIESCVFCETILPVADGILWSRMGGASSQFI